MATWFRFPKALIGVSNKAGSSTLRRMASGKHKEYDPRGARALSKKESLPAILIVRDPIERAESAYNYFAGLGWPRMTGAGFGTISSFWGHLMEYPPARMDPHWAPQKLQHAVSGSHWWDYELPFDVARSDLFDGHENETRGGHRWKFTMDQSIGLRDTVYHGDWAERPKRIDVLIRQLVW